MRVWRHWFVWVMLLIVIVLVAGWYYLKQQESRTKPPFEKLQQEEVALPMPKPLSTPSPSSTPPQPSEPSVKELPPPEPPMPTIEEILQKLSGTTETKKQKHPLRLENVSLKTRLKALNIKMGDWVFIRIFKKEKLLEVWMRQIDGEYVHVKDYAICAYSGHLGPKLKEGDKQAPEGFYRVYKRQLNPHSRFHLAFNLGYPNAYDRAHHRTGSYLMVHGKCASIGCYAMTDKRIDEIYALVEAALKHGQPYVPVHIFPFRMEPYNLNRYTQSRWYDFWLMLKEGYDYFESEHRPPLVEVEQGNYVILESEPFHD